MTNTGSNAGQATDQSRPLEGLSVWLFSDGTAEAMGWKDALIAAIEHQGASSVDSVSVVGAIGLTAKNLFEMGTERLRSELRLRRNSREVSAEEELRTGSPDVIVLDGPGHTRALQLLRDALPVRPMLVSLVADLTLYQDWSQAHPDGYIIPSEIFAEPLGVAPGSPSIEIAGPPVAPQFLLEMNKSDLRKQAGLAEDGFFCFVDAETMRPDTIENLVRSLSRCESQPNYLIYHGRNGDAAEQLRNVAHRYGLRANMFGFTPNLARYIALSDVGFVGGGNRRLSSYFAAGLPMFAIDAAHEVSAGAAQGALVMLNDPNQARYVLDEIVAEGVAQAHRDAVHAFAAQLGSEQVAHALGRLVARRDQLTPSLRQNHEPGTSQQAGERVSPFETIGTASAAGIPGEERKQMSRSSAKEALARLIMEERRVEDDVERVVRERDRWLERQQLANEDDDTELGKYAQSMLDDAFSEVEKLQERLESITSEKQQVRLAVAASVQRGKVGATRTPETTKQRSYEERFRQLEMKRDIDRLRKKASAKSGSGE